MISTLITLLIVVLIAYLVWWCVGLFIQGKPHQVIGIIIGLVVLLYALKLFGVRLPLIIGLALALSGCKTTDSTPVTAPVRSSITGSITASERSSAKIREFRSNAERIEYKAGRALRYFDAEGRPEWFPQ